MMWSDVIVLAEPYVDCSLRLMDSVEPFCVNYLTEDFALAQRAICLQPYSKTNSEYFKFAMMSSQFQHLIEASSNGMTARGIKSAKLKLLPLPIPPIEAQDKVVETIENAMSLCDLPAQNIIKEESIKSGLLKRLWREFRAGDQKAPAHGLNA